MAFELPPLPYAYDALEPHIDARTMEIHHSKHHQGYTNKLNAALDGTDWADTPIEEILSNLDALPADIQTAVRNNGGGFYNHALFWTSLSPNGGGEPTGALGAAINEKFGSYDAFKAAFKKASTGQFGSGWGWLGLTAEGALAVHGLPNQDNPVMHGAQPILGLDVWEHAYYLHYQNRRGDYVDHFFELIDWAEADRRYTASRAQ
ncbi:MAG: superoxide dismutase [Bacteroidota bacterium]